MKNVGNCVEDVASYNLVFPHYRCLSKKSKREREREREWESKENFGLSIVPAFFVTLELLTPTLPSLYKTEPKKLKEKTEEGACLETTITFSIGSLFSKVLHLSVHLSLLVT